MLLSFFELLSGCCYGATSVPTSVPKETAIAPCRTVTVCHLLPRLERRKLEILSTVMYCPNYSCWFWRSDTWGCSYKHLIRGGRNTPESPGRRGDAEVGFIVGGGCGEHQTRIILM